MYQLVLLASLVAQPSESPIIGFWELKSVTVDGETAAPKDLKDFLKKAGGIQKKMLYKIHKINEEKETFISMNDQVAGYGYDAEKKELYVESGEKDHEFEYRFDVGFPGKDMKLRFKENGKIVEMLFARDE